MISKLQEKMNSYQRVWAEIDLDAIWENVLHMKENIDQGSRCEETDPDPGIYFSLLL